MRDTIMPDQIEEYIRNSYEKGMTKENIRYNLLLAGHDINQIDTYLSTIPDNEKNNIDSGMNENETIDYSSNNSIQNNNREKNPSNSNKKRLFFFGVAIVLLFVVIASAFLFLGKDSPDQANTSDDITDFKNEVSDNSSNTNTDVNKVVFKNTTSTPTNSKVDENGFLTYDEEIDGIKIKYPEDWIVIKKPDKSLSYAEYSITFAYRPEDGLSYGQSFAIIKYKPEIVSAKSYFKQRKENLINFPPSKIIKTSDTTFYGQKTKKLTYTYDMRIDLKYTEWITTIDNTVFIFVYGADMEDYEKYEYIGDEMMDSFEIVK